MINGFVHRRAGHCGSGALRDLLEHQGLDYGNGPLSEGAVFGLGGGLGAYYYEADQLMYLVGRTGEMERDIAPNLDAQLEIRHTDDPAEGWEWVRDEIDAGRVPMVWADIARLEYLRVRMTNTRHDVLVVGYDEAEGIALVADNDRDELQRCSLESLAAARNSDGFPGPNRHRTFLYTWPEALPDQAAAAQRGLERAVANMRTEGGLAAIEAFAEGYPAWPERFADVDGTLRTLSALIVKAGTGGAMFRSLHATFLSEFGFATAANIYEKLSAAWVDLATFARAGDHDAGLRSVAAIAELERSGVEAMEKASLGSAA